MKQFNILGIGLKREEFRVGFKYTYSKKILHKT